MDGYVTDILLALSLVAAPVIFGLLLYYGLTIKDRHHHEDDGAENRLGPAARNPSADDDTPKAKSA